MPLRLLTALVLALLSLALQAQPRTSARPVLKVLIVGNSLMYANNGPALLRAIAASQPDSPRIETTSFLSPGASLAEHWRRGAVPRALGEHHWDAVIVQERGGLLACLADPATRVGRECRDSERAHRQLLALANARGIRVLLLGTWGPNAAWQSRLDAGLDALRCSQGCERLYMGRWLRDFARVSPTLQPFTEDAAMHPNLLGSLLISTRLYAALTGRALIDTPLALPQPLLQVTAQVDGTQPLETQKELQGSDPPLKLAASALAPLYRAVNLDWQDPSH